MGRKRKPKAGHEHCETCFSRYCKVAVEISVSCVVVRCHLLCGAVFHTCKEEEHRLLCPLEKVPCLNAGNGCPFAMSRHRLAKHLERCPASVVNCSLEWNRWPAAEDDGVFHENVLEGPRVDEQLDLSMALRDQALLFQSLKMETLFPELMEMEEKATPEEVEGAVGGDTTMGVASVRLDKVLEGGIGDPNGEMQELTQEERNALAKNKDVVGVENYTSWEAIFSKELRSCQQTVKNLENESKTSDGKDQKALTSIQTMNGELAIENHERETIAKAIDVTKTGLAPWQDGVLERLGKEVNVAEYNMYLVHHGSMLIRFGQLAACTPKERDFVYGSLEPIEVETIRTFNVPSSYKAKRHHLRDPSTRAKREDKGVNTSDRVVSDEEDAPKKDEVEVTLLCSLEKELRGHAISESVGTDGLFVDVGTQTYDFPSAPFKAGASLADITADQAPGLHVQIQTESVTRRHNKSSSVFTFLCGHFFRRDEFPSHFRNTHSDIQSCLNGWFEQRCPLAYLGCTYSQKRFRPSNHRATVMYDRDISAFNLRPDVPALPSEDPKSDSPGSKCAQNLDSLNSLPFEILQHIAGFLDSFTLSQLARVSKLMRDVCATLLQERGMVSLKWEKTHSHEGSSWKCRTKVWQFSSLFSPIECWDFDETPSMSQHLKVCPFYQTQEKREPFALVGLSDSQERDGVQKSLVQMFLANKQHRP